MDFKKIVSVISDMDIPKRYVNKKVHSITIDTRKLEKGDLFIAIPGSQFDGHDFVKEAVLKGAIAVVVEKEILFKVKVPVIKVDSTLQALIQLGTFFRDMNREIPVIAVTGSVGKTTTKELISQVLETRYHVHKSSGNYNNHIGLPLTLFELEETDDVMVVELGMNHAGEISKLSQICQPDIGIITNIGTSHIGNLGSQQNIFRAKMEIVDGMSGGLLLVNGSDSFLKCAESNRAEIVLCGYNILKPKKIKLTNTGSYFDVLIDKKRYHFELSIPGEKMIMNALFAIYVGILFQIPIEDIQNVLKKYHMQKNRMNIYKIHDYEIIDDCYNASLESIYNCVSILKQRKNPKLIILGDVLELGKFSKKYHQKIGRCLKKVKNCQILLVGQEVQSISLKNAIHFSNNQELIEYVKRISLTGYTVLLKGSRRMHLEEVREILERI